MSIAVNHAVLAKGWGRFTIMHKDRKVAAIREDGTCTVYAPSFMPYHLYLETANDLDTRLNNLNNFYYWCSSRVLTLDRRFAKEILNSIGAKQAVTDRDRAAIAISYHGLSLPTYTGSSSTGRTSVSPTSACSGIPCPGPSPTSV